MSRLCVVVVLLLALPACASAATFTPAAGRAAADRAALAWAKGQRPDGAFVDPVSRRPTYGYADVMIGYGLLRAGARARSDSVTRAGFRGIEAALRHGPPKRGVFDALAHSTAYAFALRELPRDPAFVALRPRWEAYLRGVSEPFIKSTGLQACTASAECFHNHEVVGAFGDLQLLATGLKSSVPGAKLADRAALREAALRVVGDEVPAAASSSATASFGDPSRGLGLLSDTGTWPLAYHSFSTAMLAGAAADLGSSFPPRAQATLLSVAHGMASLMAPDGDVAYLGRRQQQAWALASAVYAGVVVSRLPGQSAASRGQLRAAADRAFARLVSVNRFGPGGLGAVPRPLTPATGYHGVDANQVVPSALVIFLLNLAADEAESPGSAGVRAGALPADRDGAFLEPTETGFASVRRGDLWYAVHRRTITYDLRYDFGLVALKQRDRDGRWRDVVRPRPNTRGPSHDSAGPVLIRESVRYLPFGETVSVRPSTGVVLVRGGFRSEEGVWLRRGVTFRFEPVSGGVRMSFPLRAGDAARVVTFLPAGDARVLRGGRTVSSSFSSSSVSLRPASVRLGRGYASCCDERLVAATVSLRPERSGEVAWTIRSRGLAAGGSGGGGGAASGGDGGDGGGGGLDAAVVAGGAAGALGLAALAAAAARRRRRRVQRAGRR